MFPNKLEIAWGGGGGGGWLGQETVIDRHTSKDQIIQGLGNFGEEL